MHETGRVSRDGKDWPRVASRSSLTMGEPRVWKAMGMGQVTRHQVRLLILDAPSQPTGEGIGPIPAILGVFLSLLAASALGPLVFPAVGGNDT